MKRIISAVLCLLMLVTLFVGCGGKNESLESAKAYLENMYQTGSKDEPMKLAVDKEVLSIVTVDGVTYDVEWSVEVTEGDKDSVKISEAEKDNRVLIDIPDLTETDILFTAIATIKDKKDSIKAEFKFKVVGIEVEGSDDAATDDDAAADDTASDNAGSTGNTGNSGSTGNSGNTANSGNSGSTGNSGNSGNSGSTQLKLVTDATRILKDAFALGKNEKTPYIAQLEGKVISVDKEYNDQYGSVTVTMTVNGKNIVCYNMKVSGVSGGSKVKAGDTITVQGVIKNFYYDVNDTSGKVEFTYDDVSGTEVVLKKLVVGKEETKTLAVVANPVVGTAYKFGFVSTSSTKGGTYYAAGGMNGYYMATTTSVSAAIDVYLESANGGYYLYTMIDGKKTYMNIKSTGTHVNAVYESTPGTVLKYDTAKNTLVVNAVKNGEEDEYAFGTWGDYFTIGTTQTAKDGYFCRFYK